MIHFHDKRVTIMAIAIAASVLTGCGTSQATYDTLSSDATAALIPEIATGSDTEAAPENSEGTADEEENASANAARETDEAAVSREITTPEYLATSGTCISYYKGWPTEYAITYFYDSHGRLVLETAAGTEQASYGDVREVSYQIEYSYDDAGNMISMTEYDSTGTISYSYLWEYDDAGNRVSEEYTLYSSGEAISGSVREYSYDSDGNCIAEFYQSETSGGAASVYYTYEYDSCGNVTKCSYYNEAGGITPSSVTEYIYAYDENGSILTKETVDAYETTTQTYTYDENGLLLRVTDDSWSAEGPATTTYEYDEHGNVITEIFALGMTDDDPTTATSYSRSEYAYSLFENITVYDSSVTDSPELTEAQKERVEALFYPISMFLDSGYADYNADDPASFWNIMDAVINSLQEEAYCPEGSSSDLYIGYSASVVECIASAVFADFTSLPDVSGTPWVEYSDGTYQFMLGDLPWVDDYTIQPWEDNGDGSWTVRATFTGVAGVEVEHVFTITPNTYAAETGSSLFLFSILGVEIN